MRDPPSSFGKYFLTGKIATGGMAEIFLAKLIGPSGFEKPLIIKQIHPELSGDAQFVDMFVAEAKILVSLSHGHIVPVYELGVIDGTYFIAMEYIDGPTVRALQDALAHAGVVMAPACAALIVAKVLEGLAYAHRKGVIHRDLSPRNVMLSRDGEVKLVDFGIAVRDEHRHRAPQKLVGSYPYMSPEQVRGDPIGPQSDLFSAGILLWELLGGAPLFARASPEATLEAVRYAIIEPPSSRASQVPEALDRVCARALERAPSERFSSASEFLAELNHYLYGQREPVTADDLARLVARHCPPELAPVDREGAPIPPRRSGTEPSADRPPGDAGGVRQAIERTRPHPRPGTRPHPRPDAAPSNERARGKRAPTVRTFATRPGFEEILERATPPLPRDAIGPDQVPDPVPGPGSDSTTEPLAPQDRAPSPESPAASDASSMDRDPARASRRRLRRTALGLGLGLVIMGMAWLIPMSGHRAASGPNHDARSSPTEPAAPVRPHRASTPPPASEQAPPASVNAAMPTPRPEPRPGLPDGPRASARDQARKPSPTPDAAPTQTRTAPGTLRVGANPWADVFVDGRLLGRAPNVWPIPPGHHQVDVVFPVAQRQDKRTFRVHIRSGRETALGVIDFTAPDPSTTDPPATDPP